jgi:hypothetical protein
MAVLGFVVVLVASVLPWARFNDPRIFGAWTIGWPLLAPVAALVGIAGVIVARRTRLLDQRVLVAALAGLAVLAILGAIVYRASPPLLEGSSLAPLLAVLGGLIAVTGAGRKAVAIWPAG